MPESSIASSTDITSALDAARTAFQAGEEAAAVAAVRDAATRAPDRSEAAFLLCAMLLRRGDPEAGAVMADCLARFPHRSAGWSEVGEVLLASNQKAAALICLARGLPHPALALRCGLLARELGRTDDATTAFREATTLDPSSKRAWFLLGTSLQDQRDPAAAADAYRAVLRLDPGSAEALVNLGILLQEGGDLAGAKAAYARALRAKPDSFGRIAQALPGSPRGELWLDLAALRVHLAG